MSHGALDISSNISSDISSDEAQQLRVWSENIFRAQSNSTETLLRLWLDLETDFDERRGKTQVFGAWLYGHANLRAVTAAAAVVYRGDYLIFQPRSYLRKLQDIFSLPEPWLLFVLLGPQLISSNAIKAALSVLTNKNKRHWRDIKLNLRDLARHLEVARQRRIQGGTRGISRTLSGFVARDLEWAVGELLETMTVSPDDMAEEAGERISEPSMHGGKREVGSPGSSPPSPKRPRREQNPVTPHHDNVPASPLDPELGRTHGSARSSPDHINFSDAAAPASPSPENSFSGCAAHPGADEATHEVPIIEVNMDDSPYPKSNPRLDDAVSQTGDDIAIPGDEGDSFQMTDPVVCADMEDSRGPIGSPSSMISHPIFPIALPEPEPTDVATLPADNQHDGPGRTAVSSDPQTPQAAGDWWKAGRKADKELHAVSLEVWKCSQALESAMARRDRQADKIRQMDDLLPHLEQCIIQASASTHVRALGGGLVHWIKAHRAAVQQEEKQCAGPEAQVKQAACRLVEARAKVQRFTDGACPVWDQEAAECNARDGGGMAPPHQV
jgi:hypothetical protein